MLAQLAQLAQFSNSCSIFVQHLGCFLRIDRCIGRRFVYTTTKQFSDEFTDGLWVFDKAAVDLEIFITTNKADRALVYVL